MTFVPKSGKHAIAEVVFGLVLTRAFEPHEIEQLVKSHGRFRDRLPRVARGGGFQVSFGPGFPPPEIQLPFQTGVSFERVNPDGTLNWRLKVDQNTIYVNCLDYSRWSEIWPVARQYMSDVMEITQAEAQVAQSVLQYIDVFEWSGATENFVITELLRVGNEYIPASLAHRGHLFHLHQGWFNGTSKGRRLVRAHVDAVEEVSMQGFTDGSQVPSPIVKIDTYMQDDLLQPVSTKDAFDSGWIDESFSDMHDENKNILYAFLTDEVCKRIELNVD